ncbi:MAG: hypothetical protein ACLRM8_02765 [Alistipes sp.]
MLGVQAKRATPRCAGRGWWMLAVDSTLRVKLMYSAPIISCAATSTAI